MDTDKRPVLNLRASVSIRGEEIFSQLLTAAAQSALPSHDRQGVVAALNLCLARSRGSVRQSNLMLLRAAVILSVAIPAWAGEYAVLSSGFRMRIERHETAGENIRLHTLSGPIELPAGQVAGFEPEDYVPPATPAPAPAQANAAPAPADPKQLVREAAGRWGLPPELLHSVVKAESAYRTDAVSPKGAIGLMQLMPGTAQALNADPNDPRQNVEAGVRYLRELLIKYDGSAMKALAAYNAGPGAVDRYKAVPPYPETQRYVNKILLDYQRQTKSPAK